MTRTDWAYAPSAIPPRTYLDDLLAASPEARADLLDAYGRFLLALEDDRCCFAATADNVIRHDDDHIGVARELVPGIGPLDRSASYARVFWHLAASLVCRGALGVDVPDRTVDEHALDLAGRAGVAIDVHDLGRFREHEAACRAAVLGEHPDAHDSELRTLGAHSARSAAAAGLIDADGLRLALLGAYDALDTARADRDAAQVDAVELAASRALVRSLGEELERDEWIRARLRNVKSTKAARALIAARKRILGRPT